MEKMDISLEKFDGVGVQVASAVGYSKSNLQKTRRLQIQLTRGIDSSKSNFDQILTGVDRLQDSLAQTSTGIDELVSSYNGTALMPKF